MGGSKTKSKVDIKELNSTDINLSSETFNKVENTCKATSNQSNVVNIVGSTVTKLTTSQKNAAKNTCILQTAIQTVNDTDSQNKLMSALKQGLEQNASAGIGLANAESDTSITKENKFTLKDSKKTVNEAIAGCVMQIDQSNVINIVGSTVTDSKIDQANDVMMECLSSYGVATDNMAKASSDVVSTTTSEQSQKAAGYDPIKSLGGLLSGALTAAMVPYIISCVICCCILVSIGAIFMMGGGSGSVGPEGASFSMPGMQNLSSMLPPGMKLPGMPPAYGGSSSYYSGEW
jgi:cell wall-associated NlpC family hydrolase